MGTVYNPLNRPYPLFILGFGVITAYIPGIIGASISTGWLFLLIVAPILFLYCKLELGIGFFFIIYASISLLWTEVLNIAWFHLLQLIVLSIVFVIGQNIKDLTPIFKGLAFGLGLASIVAIAQKFGYTGVYTLKNTTASLFINPNIYSEISAILLVALIVFKLWWWVPVTLPGLILVQSRAAFLALGIGLFIWAWQTNKRLAVALILAVGMIGAYFYWDRFSFNSIQERLDIWADTLNGFKFLGNGVGSFEALFPYYATHIDTELARPRYAHNDLLQIGFEFGIGSILFIMALINVFKSRKSEVVILFTVFIISMFTYPLHIPTTSFIAFLVAGYLSVGTSYNWIVWDNWRSILFKRFTTERYGEITNR